MAPLAFRLISWPSRLEDRCYCHLAICCASNLVVRPDFAYEKVLLKLLNKVAGIYGLIAVLTGAGGTFAQISLYIYSALALAGLVWGLRVVKAVSISVFSTSSLRQYRHRKIPNIHYTLPIFSLQTISFPQLGQSSSVSCGGSIHPMMVENRQIRLLSWR